ncbi:hypothetical protein KR026_002320 [Drosophila bipectinata]|nr:hypothetical protein KR026_002320 [Drosophila bipectinata]
MLTHVFFGFHRKLRDPESVTLNQVFLYGCIHNSLESVFGEIGGQTDLELLKLSADEGRFLVRIPEDFLERVRIAIALIGQYQGVPCHFQVLETSATPLELE